MLLIYLHLALFEEPSFSIRFSPKMIDLEHGVLQVCIIKIAQVV